MKAILVFLCVIASASCYSSYMNVLDEEWETYKIRFDKHYQSATEEALRMRLYAESKLNVANHNQRYYEGKESFLLETNKFSDMLSEEMKSYKGLKRDADQRSMDDSVTFIGPPDNVNLPDSMDWRKHGAVTPVKNQKQCGSCWAFSATGGLEGQHFRKTKKLVSLSEQNLVDCVKGENCDGGQMQDAFIYIKNNGGIDTEASYPYEGVDDTCRFKNSSEGATDKGYVNLPIHDEAALKKAVATVGPISVAINAADPTFNNYKEGVYYLANCNPDQLDHGVLVVGYGTLKDGQQYWLVKNSWGRDWGMKGYIMMARNRNNNCGIASDASYPLV